MIPKNHVLRKMKRSHEPPNPPKQRTVLSHHLLVASFIAARKMSEFEREETRDQDENVESHFPNNAIKPSVI